MCVYVCIYVCMYGVVVAARTFLREGMDFWVISGQEGVEMLRREDGLGIDGEC